MQGLLNRIWLAGQMLRPKLKWLLAALAAVLTLGYAWRRKSVTPKHDPRLDAALADAVRPGLERRAELRRQEAEQHKAFAEQRIAEAARERERIQHMTPSELLKASNEYARKTRERGKPKTRSSIWVVLLALCVGFANLARAQESLPYQLRDPSTGEHGWYIPDDVWRSALADALALEELQAALQRFRQALAARELETDELRRAMEFERALGAVTMAKLEASNERVERAARWYRSPRFLVPLGVVLGAAAVLVPAMVVP
jgi:hypothetical protein